MNLREVKICANDQDRRGQFFKLFLDVVPQHLQTRILNIFHHMELISEDDQFFDYRRFMRLPIDKFEMQWACGNIVARLIERLKEACVSKFGPVAEFNSEDMHDHRTCALAVATDRCFRDVFDENRYLFSINLKHKMVTFPIGKCHSDECLVDGLIREIHEEIGVMLESNEIPNEPYCKFTKVYDFTGTPVKIETNVFFIEGDYGDHICNRAVNKEPEKCGGLFIATIDDAINIAKTSGLLIADCVMCFRQCKMAE